MPDLNSVRTLPDALAEGREAVAAFSKAFLNRGNLVWPEETVTVHLLMTAYPNVQYALFNNKQEPKVGADWLWWFVDETDEAFGVLVQAKTLKRAERKTMPPRWSIDFGYRAQMSDLLESAAYFDVPAAYAVYCGDRAYRASMSCTARDHPGGVCVHREDTAVTVLPALLADELQGRDPKMNPDATAADAVHRGMPLERLAGGQPLATTRRDLHFAKLGPRCKHSSGKSSRARGSWPARCSNSSRNAARYRPVRPRPWPSRPRFRTRSSSARTCRSTEPTCPCRTTRTYFAASAATASPQT